MIIIFFPAARMSSPVPAIPARDAILKNDSNGNRTIVVKEAVPEIPEQYGKSISLLVELQRDAIFELKTENELMKASLCKLGEIQWCST